MCTKFVEQPASTSTLPAPQHCSPPMGAPNAAARPAAAPADTSSRWSLFLKRYSSAAGLGSMPAAEAACSSGPCWPRRCRLAQRYTACSAWHSIDATQAPRWIMGPAQVHRWAGKHSRHPARHYLV